MPLGLDLGQAGRYSSDIGNVGKEVLVGLVVEDTCKMTAKVLLAKSGNSN